MDKPIKEMQAVLDWMDEQMDGDTEWSAGDYCDWMREAASLLRYILQGDEPIGAVGDAIFL